MTTVKATIVQGDFKDTDGKYYNMYAVQMHHDGSLHHKQRSEQCTYAEYLNAVDKSTALSITSFSEPSIMDVSTPPTAGKTEVDAIEAVTDYLDDATKDAFTVEDITFDRPQLTPEHKQEIMEEIEASMAKEFPVLQELIKQPIPDNVDQETGEVKEVNTNNSNTNTMNKEQEASAEAQPVKKVSIARKAKHYSKVSMVLGVQAVTAPTHATLKMTADTLHLIASGIEAVNRGVRNVEVAAVTAAKISKYNREELKQRVDNRSAKIERYTIAPVTIPLSIMLAIRQNLKNPVDQPQMQTA